MKKALAILFVFLIVAALSACSSSSGDKKPDSGTTSDTNIKDVAEEETEEINEDFVSWPSGGLYDVLPKPSSDDVIINQESDEYISVEVHNTSQDDFTEYVEQLRSIGYKDREDKQKADHVFNAVNAEGYEIMSSVADVSKIMYIQFKSPESTLIF